MAQKTLSKRSLDIAAGTQKYNTPLELVVPIAEILGGFDLDPCASQDSNLAEQNIRESGGLEADWDGAETVWLNHPYGRGEPPKWLSKASQTADNTTIVTLSKADPSTDWFHEYIVGTADLVAFPDERIQFVGESSGADFPNVFVVYGDYPEALEEHFNDIGWVATSTDSIVEDPIEVTATASNPEVLFDVSEYTTLELSFGPTKNAVPVETGQQATVYVETAHVNGDVYSILCRDTDTEDLWFVLDISLDAPHNWSCAVDFDGQRCQVPLASVEVHEEVRTHPGLKMCAPEQPAPWQNPEHPSSISPSKADTAQTKLPV